MSSWGVILVVDAYSLALLSQLQDYGFQNLGIYTIAGRISGIVLGRSDSGSRCQNTRNIMHGSSNLFLTGRVYVFKKKIFRNLVG